MKNDFKQAAKEAADYIITEECPENERAVKILAAQTREGHYDNINLLVMAALLIFTAVTFLAVNNGDSADGNTMNFSWKAFFKGIYTQSLEDRYNSQLPVPETLKLAEERISLLYGIGNKLSDPIREVDEGTDSDRNSFDEPAEDKKGNADENVITTTAPVTDKNGKVTTTKKEEEKEGGGTTALDRPYETTTTTTTTAETTTTNNDAPEVTVTTTVPVPDTTTTTPEPTQTTPEPTETTPADTTSGGEGGDDSRNNGNEQ
ncbi:MAG: hypothetical protein J5994_00475 [Ruminococcus sp.]|nr:hypothetical protein [Ruminococcus sp.]